MYRFFVPVEQIWEDQAEITGDDVNHIRNVLRMSPGEKVVISGGQGMDYYCIIRDVQAERILLEIERKEAVKTELPVKLVLFQALPKADKMEWIIQKAVELGVSEIVPVRTRRAVVRLDEKKAAKKQQRWQTIAQAAAKQSGRGIIPEVHPVQSFPEALAYAKQLEYRLIPYELYEDMPETFERVAQACKGNSIGVFIGPEGGFERGEVEQAMEQGACPVSLGRRILRTETAGLTLLSVLMFQIEGQGTDRDG
ncbi:MAG: 16S rRNA (uracil(1498)-N(3))-methyltransferase [Roseburia sp.]|nr:16S rRNA (uracil(1498)-N(3))-methyltransferase [Roseburia sp.]